MWRMLLSVLSLPLKSLRYIHARLSIRRKKREEKHNAQANEIVFYRNERATSDTVVFVHGLIGHYETTWSRFPELLYDDPEIPRTNIMLWGYRSALLPTDESVADEGQRLMSDLRERLPRAQHLFLIGHSMGGLAILGGLVNDLINFRASKVPVAVTRHIALYATPVLGSEVAAIIKYLKGWIPWWKSQERKQIENLASGGDFVSELVRDVNHRIYNPTISPDEAASKRRIPITACVGLRDWLVKPTSAQAIFVDPAPVRLDHTHTSIKEPVSRDDRRYLPMQNILIAHYSSWFYDMAKKILSDAERKRWINIALRRCEHALEFRLTERRDKTRFDRLDVEARRQMKAQLLITAARSAETMHGETMGTLFDFALNEMFPEP